MMENILEQGVTVTHTHPSWSNLFRFIQTVNCWGRDHTTSEFSAVSLTLLELNEKW